MEIRTDHQKLPLGLVKGEAAVRTVEGNMELHVVEGAEISRPPCPMPVDLLQTCYQTQTPCPEQHRETAACDPDIVSQQPVGKPGELDDRHLDDFGEAIDSVPLLRALSSDRFTKSCLDSMVDIPMIDEDVDDEEEDDGGSSAAVEGTCIDASYQLSAAETPSTTLTVADAYVLETVIPITEEPMANEEGRFDGTNDAQRPWAPVAAPLKSALRKSGTKSKKGLKVSFQDTRVFYIDTEAETTAEPQLYTVHSLDLPLTTADYRVFIPVYDFLPSMPHDGHGDGVGSYSYEKAIVTLANGEDIDDDTGAAVTTDLVAGEFLPNGSGADENDARKLEEVPTTVCESGDAQDLPLEERTDASGEAVPVNGGVVEEQKEEQPVQSLTEANLRQHEMLMERDDMQIAGDSEAKVSVSDVQPTEVLAAITPTGGGKTLSPPLKELSVDVGAIAPVNGAGGSGHPVANWQVELSPLNSIPDSETDSSASSQDTMIMMTSEECRRNEEHIRHSTLAYRQACKSDEAKNNDTASVGSGSQDSDETLKCDESVDPGYQPPWMKTIDVEDTVNRNRIADFNQRTSSQIRQLMERNAVRRSLLRYSNTRKKTGDELPIEKQRQWQSHESLLDTIKQLTIENEESGDGIRDEGQLKDMGADSANDAGIGKVNGFHGPPPQDRNEIQPSRLYGSREKSTSNLSLQDSCSLIAYPSAIEDALQRRSQSTTNMAVPGDVRQWKIQSNRWNMVRGYNVLNGMRNAESVPVVSQSEPPPAGSTDANRFGGQGTFRTSAANSVPYSGPGDASEPNDELAVFVQQDSDRIERLRKRYSYTDGSDYDAVSAFARRPSVRGIKPRFGSTTEILQQMQSQLQPQPLTKPPNGRNHMTWPYPEARQSAETIGTARSNFTAPVTVPATNNNINNRLPVVQEEIYGPAAGPGQQRPTHTMPSDASSKPYLRARRGREGIYGHLDGPPPYQPPPPAPPSVVTAHSLPPSAASQYHYPHRAQAVIIPTTAAAHASPVRNQAKDERGVPEGASSSPKTAFDSVYRSTAPATAKKQIGPPTTVVDNSGVVYYVMQV